MQAARWDLFARRPALQMVLRPAGVPATLREWRTDHITCVDVAVQTADLAGLPYKQLKHLLPIGLATTMTVQAQSETSA